MITKYQLYNWMTDNGEDVLVDGPFILTDSQRSEFLEIVKSDKKIIKHLIKEGCIDFKEDVDNFDNLSVGSYDKSSVMILNRFVNFLNKEGFVLDNTNNTKQTVKNNGNNYTPSDILDNDPMIAGAGDDGCTSPILALILLAALIVYLNC